MGYRIEIISQEDSSVSYYGTKLFGYVETEKLLSYRYLKFLGKLDETTIFDYGFDNQLNLTEKEFECFIFLYALDLEKYKNVPADWFINEPDIFKLRNISGNKVIDWG